MSPEWLSAWSSLLATVFAFATLWKLVSKDHDREREIANLVRIANEQNKITKQLQEQVQELKKQTFEFEAQTKIMEQAVSISKEDQVREMELAAMRRSEYRDKLKPYFKKQSGYDQNPFFYLVLKNTGGNAKNMKLETPEVKNYQFTDISKITLVEKGNDLNLQGSVTTTDFPNNLNAFGLVCDLIFSDVEGYFYRQKIVRKDGNFTIEPPEDISQMNH